MYNCFPCIPCVPSTATHGTDNDDYHLGGPSFTSSAPLEAVPSSRSPAEGGAFEWRVFVPVGAQSNAIDELSAIVVANLSAVFGAAQQSQCEVSEAPRMDTYYGGTGPSLGVKAADRAGGNRDEAKVLVNTDPHTGAEQVAIITAIPDPNPNPNQNPNPNTNQPDT